MEKASIKVRAPAKINLTLHVIGQREDGYHLLDSLVVFTELGDEIFVGPSKGENILSIVGEFSDQLSCGNDNLVSKAAHAFKERFGLNNNYEIELIKNLPISSGIGGGSADAAATLIALANANDIGDTADLPEIGIKLGADVPMCLHSQTLIAKGIGEEIESIEAFPSFEILLVNPKVEVSTPEIFKRLSSKMNTPQEDLLKDRTQVAMLDWLCNQRNDLQAPAIKCEPIIEDVLRAIDQAGALLVRMSGSGATCFGLYVSKEECETARLQILKKYPDWWVVATHTKEFGIDRVSIGNGDTK